MKTTIWASLTIIFLVSCMAGISLQNRYNTIENSVKTNNYKQALIDFETNKQTYGNNDKALYLLDNGILNFYAGDNQTSFNNLEQADKLMEELYTKSISSAALSYVSNDYALDYDGEDYEQVYVNIFKAITYANQNNNNSALIEIRRMHDKFKELNTRYQKEISELKKQEGVAENKNLKFGDYKFTDSSLARYLSLIMYRTDGEYSDAEIDMRKLIEHWNLLKELHPYGDMRNNEFRFRNPKKDSATVNLLSFIGQGPKKYAWELDVLSVGKRITITGTNPTYRDQMDFTENPDLTFKFSIPRIMERPSRIKTIKLLINGNYVKDLRGIEHIGLTAINTFKMKETSIIIKSLIRGIGKAIISHNLTKDMQKDDKDIGGMFFKALTQSAISSTEEADLRAWQLLPNEAYVSEITLAFGTYQIRLDYLDNNNLVIGAKTVDRTLTKTNSLNLVTDYAL